MPLEKLITNAGMILTKDIPINNFLQNEFTG